MIPLCDEPFDFVIKFESDNWYLHDLRVMLGQTGLSPPVKYFTDRSKVVLLLWIICVVYVLCLSFFRVCSLLPCGYLLGKG